MYKIGLTVSPTSIGWAVLSLDEKKRVKEIIDAGVRVFSSGRSPKTNASFSVDRRLARGMRRNRNRYLARRNKLNDILLENGFISSLGELDKFDNNVLKLRAISAQEKVGLDELAKILLLINKRRGYLSNRAENDADTETQGLKKGIVILEETLAENKITLGQYLYEKSKSRKIRLNLDKAESEWTSRKMYSDEFKQIISVQQRFHPVLNNDDLVKNIEEAIFLQLPLKPQEVGYCTLVDGEKRVRKAHVIANYFRILQEVNMLSLTGIQHRSLSKDEKKLIVHYLTKDFSLVTKAGILSWSKIGKIIGEKKPVFNLDCNGRKGLKCDITSRAIKEIAPERWETMNDDDKYNLVEIIESAQTQTDFEYQAQLVVGNFTDEEIFQLSDLKLEPSFLNVSRKAIKKLQPYLENGDIYYLACQNAGIEYKDFASSEFYGKGDLPYYGEVMEKQVVGGSYSPDDLDFPEKYFGKINNPTIHIVLNQLRKVINAIIIKQGAAPLSISFDVADEVGLTEKGFAEKNKNTRLRQKQENLDRDTIKNLGFEPSRINLMKYRLWTDLAQDPKERLCPFSGRKIDYSDLFSEKVVIGHIVPYSRSFDDSRNNKIVYYFDARLRPNLTPIEDLCSVTKAQDVFNRAENMSPEKVKNGVFKPKKYDNFLVSGTKGFRELSTNLPRRILNTSYPARIISEYLRCVIASPNRYSKVYSVKGGFMRELFYAWGFNAFQGEKIKGKYPSDRDNYHHHVLHAILSGLVDSNLVFRMVKANEVASEIGSFYLFEKIGYPYERYSADKLSTLLSRVNISHKLDRMGINEAVKKHITVAKLHEDTFYGEHKEGEYLVKREPFIASAFMKKSKISMVCGERVKDDLFQMLKKAERNSNNLAEQNAYFEKEFDDYKSEKKINKIRVKFPKGNKIAIRSHPNGKKVYAKGGGNFCAVIFKTIRGKKANNWQTNVISNFKAHQGNFDLAWSNGDPTAKKIMTLYKNDVLALSFGENRKLYRVAKMTMPDLIFLEEINNNTGESKLFMAKKLFELGARKVFIDEIGQIKDGGFRE